MKETELRLADVRKAKNDFERRLVKPTKDNTLEMKEPEKVLQYIEDKLKVTKLVFLTKQWHQHVHSSFWIDCSRLEVCTFPKARDFLPF